MEYLRNLRLNQAEKFLRTTRRPLSEISDRCGFRDSNYFIMCFRQRYGITPHQYRKLFYGKESPRSIRPVQTDRMKTTPG